MKKDIERGLFSFHHLDHNVHIRGMESNCKSNLEFILLLPLSGRKMKERKNEMKRHGGKEEVDVTGEGKEIFETRCCMKHKMSL